MKFNRKLLIYVNEADLKPTGGASGYNYNMQQGLQEIETENYFFLKNVDQTRNKFKSLQRQCVQEKSVYWTENF